MHRSTRRGFLRTTSLSLPAIALSGNPLLAADKSISLPPVRQLTLGSRFHWFGYYDKLQFCPKDRLVLSNEVEFEHRSPTANDKIGVGMVDTQNNDEWIELGKTNAWCWQQGCMLQWLPHSESEVIWNDRLDNRFVSHVLDVNSGKKRTLPHAVYNVAPDGKRAIATDFARLNDCRPGYGYVGLPDKNKSVGAPEDSGLWIMDIDTGERDLIMSFAQAVEVPFEGDERWQFKSTTKHWFNHLLFNTDGSRIWFLHRWTNGKGWATRAFTINPDGTDPYVLDPYGRTSHFIWRDPEHVMAWAWHPSHGASFYLFKDRTNEVTAVGPDVMNRNGHNTYVPGTNGQWVLNDTYPDDDRMQHPYLYHVPTNRKVALGQFKSPSSYHGEWRCDTHPRSSRNGRLVCIDSPHNGGRQLYLIDVSEILSSSSS